MIKALFMSTPYPGKQKFGGQPTGLLYALSILGNKGENIQVWCPEGLSNETEDEKFKIELEDFIKKSNPKILGISTFSVSYKNALKIMKFAKEISTEIVVIFGGAHEDNFVKYYREKKNIDADFVIAGDGMFILYKLYKLIENNSHSTVEEIKRRVSESKEEFSKLEGAGILLYNQDGKLKEIKTIGIPISLDKIPIISRHLLKDGEKIAKESFTIFNGKKTAQIIVGRGCPYYCAFCSESLKKVWYGNDSPKSINFIRSLKHVEKELNLIKKQGYTAIFFDDSTFLGKPKNYLEKLFDLLNKYDFEWGCQTTQNSVYFNKDLLSKMKKSGCSYIYIGIEHFDGETRDAFGNNKYGNVSTEAVIELLKKYGIRVGISLTFGHPDESDPKEATKENEKTVRYTIDKMADLIKKCENVIGISLNIITYQPGTICSERYEKKVGKILYTDIPNDFEPFRSFEEGIGPHAIGVTIELAEFILSYAKIKIGKKLFV